MATRVILHKESDIMIEVLYTFNDGTQMIKELDYLNPIPLYGDEVSVQVLRVTF